MRHKKLIIFGIGEYAELAYFYFKHDTAYKIEGFTVNQEYIVGEHFCKLPVVPFEEIKKALSKAKKVGVIDRAISYGQEGPFYNEIKASLYGGTTPLYGFIAGLGGRDVSIRDIESTVEYMQKKDPENIIWIGVKE